MSNPCGSASCSTSVPLTEVQSQLLSTSKEKARARRLLAKHHYLGDVRAVGEQLFYAITDGRGDWLGVLVFCAASRRLRARDGWINWSEEQRRRRLPLVVNHCRFLLVPNSKRYQRCGVGSEGKVAFFLSALNPGETSSWQAEALEPGCSSSRANDGGRQ